MDATVSYIHTFKSVDIDGDGDLDLVTAEMHQSDDPDEVSVYYNLGGGLTWSQQVLATSGLTTSGSATSTMTAISISWAPTGTTSLPTTPYRALAQ